jgi:hypothetical protein
MDKAQENYCVDIIDCILVGEFELNGLSGIFEQLGMVDTGSIYIHEGNQQY